MEELYKVMKEIRDNYYLTGRIEIESELFFRLFKLVCDVRSIERIVDFIGGN